MVPSTFRLLTLLLVAAPLQLPRLVVPNFPDLTLKTRRTDGDRYSNTETLYLKGSRQRSEYLIQNAGSSVNRVTITQCDEKLRLHLDNKERTYASFPIEDWARQIKRTRPTPQVEMTGADVEVSIDSVDTGERRTMGSHELRRVKTTTKVEPGRGAATLASVTEVETITTSFWLFETRPSSPNLPMNFSASSASPQKLHRSTIQDRSSSAIELRHLGAALFAVTTQMRKCQGRTIREHAK